MMKDDIDDGGDDNATTMVMVINDGGHGDGDDNDPGRNLDDSGSGLVKLMIMMATLLDMMITA